MERIVFFGLGAVGSVMATCLYELCQRRNKKKLQLVFVVRDAKEAKRRLFNAPHVMKSAQFLEAKDFKLIFSNSKQHPESLVGADILINAASPKFNKSILKLAVELEANYCDLASDMYNEQTLKTLQFPQQTFHKSLQQRGLFGLINVGISPGVTNFLIGEKVTELRNGIQPVEIKNIHLFLLEQIDSDQVVFSWSPTNAMDELEAKPRYIENNKLVAVEPFSHSEAYDFPHFARSVAQYPIYQEEVLSFRDSYPKVSSIRVSSGGSEVELIKSLFQLNLLSKQNVECVAGHMSVEKIIRMVLPGMQSSQKIEGMLKNGVIKYAHFAAMAEITLKFETAEGKFNTQVQTTGLNFNRYSNLLRTPYSGATYISYPTGIGAAILVYFTHQIWQKDKRCCSGVLKAEDLPHKMGTDLTNQLKRDLCAYQIDLVSHSHSFLHDKK